MILEKIKEKQQQKFHPCVDGVWKIFGSYVKKCCEREFESRNSIEIMINEP